MTYKRCIRHLFMISGGLLVNHRPLAVKFLESHSHTWRLWLHTRSVPHLHILEGRLYPHFADTVGLPRPTPCHGTLWSKNFQRPWSVSFASTVQGGAILCCVASMLFNCFHRMLVLGFISSDHWKSFHCVPSSYLIWLALLRKATREKQNSIVFVILVRKDRKKKLETLAWEKQGRGRCWGSGYIVTIQFWKKSEINIRPDVSLPPRSDNSEACRGKSNHWLDGRTKVSLFLNWSL